ncbi:Spliceosome-associated protein 61 [Intoshia linei]|uniref:Spliceosome-associated protein 61 n=1 Tax=Intoshia linei TaxID=1819745 RepID=A0A177BBS3_9BILA|nr:Spliceosome-associated protein 61 [Intoshia linei]
MDNIIEQQRYWHELADRLLDGIVEEKLVTGKTLRDKVNSNYRLHVLTNRYLKTVRLLKESYADVDGIRKKVIKEFAGPNEISIFYSKLRAIKNYHKKNPNLIHIPLSAEFEAIKKQRENQDEDVINLVTFSDVEGYGRYLDLNDIFNTYLNIKGIAKIDYVTYLTIFDRLFDIPKEKKFNVSYKNYLNKLLDYLVEFSGRIDPNKDLVVEYGQIRKHFLQSWSDGTFKGWQKEATTALTKAGAYLDLTPFSSWQELTPLGLGRLKSALQHLGCKIGGSLEERAQRLFHTKNKDVTQLDKSFFTTKSNGKSNNTEANFELAWLECKLYHLFDYLTEQRKNTRENTERKQARTAQELIDEESDDEASESEQEVETFDSVPYNPKNLPLGWDGKPIPYWLYKLHGLNIHYTCEICGDASYRGPKAFSMHFSDWRHSAGMRILGIPNSPHFANIVKIKDALMLWETICQTKDKDKWIPEDEEEFEDSRGNVINNKTYHDLKRQGLV